MSVHFSAPLWAAFGVSSNRCLLTFRALWAALGFSPGRSKGTGEIKGDVLNPRGNLRRIG